MIPSRYTLSARYLLPVEGPPIEGGFLAVEGGRIAEVGRAEGRRADSDLGNVAILPGFVNAHTHLELGPIPPEGAGPEDEIAWLGRVIAQRRGRPEADLRTQAMKNLAASVLAGTTLLADTTTAGLSWEALVEAPIRSVVFAELIGLARARGLETSHAAFEWLARARKRVEAGDTLARPGLSPHAPYSTAGWLYHRAAVAGVPLSTHLAELPEERQLLRQRRGPLRRFLEDLGAWDDDWQPIGNSPADYVRKGDLRRADWLIAHGTYLDESEFWQLRPEAAPAGQRVAVVYCPRTHARFGHAPHPYRRMLDRGAVVCLGTDGLASAPSLGLLDEIRFLHRRDPEAGGRLLLTMATLFGAWALRLDHETGSLAPGKSADLAVVALPDRDDADPYRLVLESDLPVVATACAGRFLTGPWTDA